MSSFVESLNKIILINFSLIINRPVIKSEQSLLSIHKTHNLFYNTQNYRWILVIHSAKSYASAIQKTFLITQSIILNFWPIRKTNSSHKLSVILTTIKMIPRTEKIMYHNNRNTRNCKCSWIWCKAIPLTIKKCLTLLNSNINKCANEMHKKMRDKFCSNNFHRLILNLADRNVFYLIQFHDSSK